jgi:hypothetical protein
MGRFIPFTSNDGVFQCAVACGRVAFSPCFEFGKTLSRDGIYRVAAVVAILRTVDTRTNDGSGKERCHKNIGDAGQHGEREEQIYDIYLL